MRIFLRCILALVAIWLFAAGAIFWIQSSQPTPQRFMSFIAEHPLDRLSPRKRDAIIHRAARQLNGLTLEQRQELKETGVIRKFFAQLTSDERRRFLALTVPDGFRQLIAALNKMESVERNRLVQRTLRNVRRHSAEVGAIGGEEDIPRMISQGRSIFERDASPEVQRAFAPVLEEIKRRQIVPDPGASSDATLARKGSHNE